LTFRVNQSLAKTSASVNYPSAPPPRLTQIDAPFSSRLSRDSVLGFKPQLRLEWRGQDGQNDTKQPDHSASLGDFITSSTRIRFSVHTTPKRLPK